MIPVHIAIVDTTGQIPATNLARAAGSFSEQLQHDVAPIWKVSASVGVYPEAPPHTWAILIQEQLDQPGALGYHTDDNNQPISYVELTDDWTVTLSHEGIEMLGDPFGNRMHNARLPFGLEADYRQFGVERQNSHVRYLLELCDPPEAKSYQVGGVPMSDFLLPQWYRSVPLTEWTSRCGNCTEPRQVIDGGYVSFSNRDGEWFQVFNEGGQLDVSDLGKFDKSSGQSLREWADSKAREYRKSH